MRRLSLTLICALFALVQTSARERKCFDEGWLFALADSAQMASASYGDSGWRQLDLPHDWAIEGDFSPANPSGAGGGALPGGVGWYRKHFKVGSADKYFIEFDGVYMNATVYVNGHLLGNRPYGYSSFEYELTPYLNRGGDNVIAVRVDNSDQPNSRWYSGCGIYRHVWLTSTADVHIDHWGVYVKTSSQGDVEVEVKCVTPNAQVRPTMRNTVLDANGLVVAKGASSKLQSKLKVRRPHLWSVTDPYIYKVRTEILVNNQVVDEVETVTGFRYFKFDPQKGFSLNGQSMKINGVCEHHDLGCLGAAINEDALHRKLSILKEMGVNAVRCSHNPPAPELL